MKKTVFLLSWLVVVTAQAADSEATQRSPFNMADTANRYAEAVKNYGAPYVETQESEQGLVVLFTNPFFGTAIGKCAKGTRMDEPLQARVWKDEKGAVWVSYLEPRPIINNYGTIECGSETDNLRKVLHGFADAATGP